MATTSDVDVEALVAALTLEEKCRMVVGRTRWIISGCERLGIPEWCVSDGPVGVRGRMAGSGLLVPSPSALAATWDPELVREVAGAIGEECRDRNVDMLLAPTVNVHRSPRGGRHFEAYSEDPELSSRICVGFVEGVQSRGVGACVKHFVANDQEFERTTINVDIDERTLREIYLPAFEAAVTEAGVKSVMGAYNYVNGHHACAHNELLVDLLKGEWGFDGFVVSDWDAIKDTVAPARFGLDLEMPGPGKFWGAGQLQTAVERGDVPADTVDDKVRRIIGFLAWAGRIGTPTNHDESPHEQPEHRTLAHRAATEATVLLKNTGDALPLGPTASVALIGPAAHDTAVQGGGSAMIGTYRTTTVADALRDRLGNRLIGVEAGLSMRRTAASVRARMIDDGVTFDLFDGIGFDGECFATETSATPFGVWFDEGFPGGHDTVSVRTRFRFTPIEAGSYRACAKGSGAASLFIDDAFVCDNEDGFSAGLGFKGGEATVELEAGRSYDIRLDYVPRAEGQRFCLLDVGLEPIVETLIDDAVRLAAEADIAVVVVGSNEEWESEGSDRDSLALPNGQDELVRRVIAANPATVVVLNCGAPMGLPWFDDATAVLLAWYPGQEGGEAIADVLTGVAEPSGRMPTTWAVDERDTPSFLHYPGEAGVARYGEGIFVGYRGYDARGVAPRLPFGHGGSYTSFGWGDASVSGSGTRLTVDVPITNTGDRRGSEVVQVYVAADEHLVARPPKELAGFAKVEVEPGETDTARIELRRRAFARWDPSTHAWVEDPGTYRLLVAASAVDVRSEVAVEI